MMVRQVFIPSADVSQLIFFGRIAAVLGICLDNRLPGEYQFGGARTLDLSLASIDVRRQTSMPGM